MPPKRRPVNVVRSGNAGNSSKAKPKDDPKDAKGKGKDGKGAPAADDKPARPPPLFPVGYKSPVTILNEKCQKMGWERPIIDTVGAEASQGSLRSSLRRTVGQCSYGAASATASGS